MGRNYRVHASIQTPWECSTAILYSIVLRELKFFRRNVSKRLSSFNQLVTCIECLSTKESAHVLTTALLVILDLVCHESMADSLQMEGQEGFAKYMS